MGVADLLRARLVVPRSRAGELLNELYRFGDFHVTEQDGDRLREVEDLYSRARSIYIELEATSRELNLTVERGPLQVLMEGDLPDTEEMSVSDVKEALDLIEREARPILEELRALLQNLSEVSERLKYLTSRAELLEVLRGLGRTASELWQLKRFHVSLFTLQSSAFEEARRAFQDFVVQESIGEGRALLAVICRPRDSERVVRIARGLNLLQVQLDKVPQDVEAELSAVRRELEELRRREEELRRRLSEIREEKGPRLAALRDLALEMKESLDRFREAGLRRAVVIEGYLPREREEEFLSAVGRRAYVELEEAGHNGGHGVEGHGHGGQEPPTLLRHNKFFEAFRPITMMQGIPGYGEIDPTPFVSVFLMVFYGIMFADLGQGLIMAVVGYLLMRRARSYLRVWGKLLLLLGLSAAAVGFAIQEAFGFGIYNLTGLKPVIELVEHHGEAKVLSQQAILTLFSFAPLLGFVHITLGMLLGAVKYAKAGELGEAIFSKGVSVAMYVFGLLFAIAFIGAGGFDRMFTSQDPAPLVGLPVARLGTISVYGILASLMLLIVGRPISGMLGIGHKTSLVAGIGAGLLEVLENVIHFMSNTLSYLRVPILMVIHVALMMLVNAAWEGLGLASLPILIIGNIGIMALEGTLAFIQALRLHLYEFFSKFYEGSGTPFRPLRLESRLLRLVFR
jgi:V/A-type H+-transporting ATPase subunit I